MSQGRSSRIGDALLARARRLAPESPRPALLVPLRGPHGDELPVRQDLRLEYARGQPTTFAPRQVIAAWTEAMQKMKVGSKWELVCPPEIAYGGRAMGSDIPANSVLVFTMEMLSCQGVSAEL